MTHEAHHHDHDSDHGHHHGHDHGNTVGGALREIFAPHSHHAGDSIDSALESSAAGIRAVKVSLLVLGATALAQIGIVAISGSVALLADTIHNFSDALTAIPLWIAFALGTRAATRRYTYGFGRAEDLAGLFVVAMIAYGALVANVCFTSWRRRAVFMAVCVVVPVLANGVRAFGTIYAAHLTSVRAATGFDHIVYGWIFFALVMAGVMAAAWRCPSRATPSSTPARA